MQTGTLTCVTMLALSPNKSLTSSYTAVMVLRRFHYDQAFEHYLRANAVPYVAVDEAKRSLMRRRAVANVTTNLTPAPIPGSSPGSMPGNIPANSFGTVGQPHSPFAGRKSGETRNGDPSDAWPLKNFDFVVYAEDGPNLLVDVKGRKLTASYRSGFQNWVTQDDVDSLQHWAQLFGPGFEPAFVFLHWCDVQPPDALFHEVFELAERWYIVQAVRLADYLPAMRTRSERWQTVSIPASHFQKVAQPLGRLLGTTDAR